MGITLVEHVLDHAPDDLTPAEWRGLIVLAQDANEKSRETYHGPNHELILRRVRMSESRWNSVRSSLVKKGALVQLAGGHRGAVAKYKIPVFENGKVAGSQVPMQPHRLPETDGKVAGFRQERLPKSGNPTPPSPASLLSPQPSQQNLGQAVTSADEREIDQILNAYTQALGRKPTASVAQKISDQAAKLLADGLLGWWIADRARELPERGWTDLAQHCDRSTVPIEVQRPADKAPACTAHDAFSRMIRDPATGDLINCPACHEAEVARRRRQGAA